MKRRFYDANFKIRRKPTNDLRYYSGPQEQEASARYIEELFIAQCENKEKQLYVHQTCATDTEQVKFVIAAVMDVCVNHSLKEAGIID